MTNSTDKLRVFLCHVHDDKEHVRKLYALLKAYGFYPWLDEEDLVGGQEWEPAIAEAIRKSDAFLVCLSSQSVDKEGYVQSEISKALKVAEEKPEGTIYIIPGKLEECELPRRLSRWHCIALEGSNGYKQLVRSLNTKAVKLGKRLGCDGEPPEVETRNGIVEKLPYKNEYELVQISGGEFWMGSPEGEKCRNDDEGPRHLVKIEDFYLGKYPVTNEEYGRFLEANPEAKKPKYWNLRQFSHPKQPVVGVSWDDAQEYCAWAGLRLPTEAEWEYACRAGTETSYYSGDKGMDLARVGWYIANSEGYLHMVGEKEPNEFGLYDMHGNVWEWVEDDVYNNYRGAPKNGAAWVNDPRGGFRVLRGGSSIEYGVDCRSARRGSILPDVRKSYIGYRLGKSIP